MSAAGEDDSKMRLQKKISAGTTLLKEQPFVFVLSSKLHTQYCDNCFQKGQLLKCSNCQFVYYCGKGCQREAWSIHKPECVSLRRVAPRVIPDAARLLARLIRKLRKGGDLVKSYYTEGNFRMFKDLMSHYTDLKENSKKMEHFVSLCGVLFDFLGGESLPNSAELMGMYGRMCVNSFNICDAEMVALGTGIYLGASVIDHSCRPNAVATFEGTTLYIRAIEDLPCLDWTHIHISYIDVIATTESRRDELQHTYYFICQCPKCVDTSSHYVTGAACQHCIIGCVNSKTFKCEDCGEAASIEFIEKFREIVEFSDGHLKNMQDMAYLDVCKFCLDRQKGVLHKLNRQYVRTLDLGFQASIDFGQWKDAQVFATELIDGYKMYYGDVHPLLGLLYLKLGKILVYKAKCNDALQYLKLAFDNLKLTHGDTSRLFRDELLPLMQQARLETGSF
ncbi:histone-lysine N-methyltransferase SMYD3-like isoform X1 [Atheta coriaria]|uniref:histone-lysine N-methyltransferase SMYD3-like isoform X1 n=1 Tax=Dalotia coriaria TaxID=877792 RepID=UPI0031F3776D